MTRIKLQIERVGCSRVVGVGMVVEMIVAIPAAGVAGVATVAAATAAAFKASGAAAAKDAAAAVSGVVVGMHFGDGGLVLPRRKLFPILGLVLWFAAQSRFAPLCLFRT